MHPQKNFGLEGQKGCKVDANILYGLDCIWKWMPFEKGGHKRPTYHKLIQYRLILHVGWLIWNNHSIGQVYVVMHPYHIACVFLYCMTRCNSITAYKMFWWFSISIKFSKRNEEVFLSREGKKMFGILLWLTIFDQREFFFLNKKGMTKHKRSITMSWELIYGGRRRVEFGLVIVHSTVGKWPNGSGS